MKVIFVHFRVGRTDGVSLEIAEWSEILRDSGVEVAWCSGRINQGADWVIEGLEMELDAQTREFNDLAFRGGVSEAVFGERFAEEKKKLKLEFERMVESLQPDVLWVSNLFAIALNLPATVALHEVVNEKNIKVVAVHHDFYWEAIRARRPAYLLVEEVLERSFPPAEANFKHVCINSLAQAELYKRKGLKSEILPDTLDFEEVYQDKSGNCRGLLERMGVGQTDLVVLQATRIVPRKNIELAIDLVKLLGKRVEQLNRQRVVLVLGGYAEKRAEGYRQRLIDYAAECGVEMVLLPVDECDLYDLYPRCDLVTYVSEYEGFGNQFLEAIRAKKPVVLFEYPVYVADIKSEGFEVISLGDKLAGRKDGLAKIEEGKMSEAADQCIELFNDREKKRLMVEKNFQLGKLNYGREATKARMKKLLEI